MTEFTRSGKQEILPAPAHYEVWRNLGEKGYVVLSDRDLASTPPDALLQGSGDVGWASSRQLGFDPTFRMHLGESYFNKPGVLKREHYPGVFPEDRERARDVIRYFRDGHQIHLQEHDTIAISPRSYDKEPGLVREYQRIRTLEDPVFAAWAETVLSLVPPDRRDPQGTFGINFFRTHSKVTNEERPHQDDEQWVGILLRDKLCDGAETFLYGKDEYGVPKATPFFGVTLEPGDFLFFDDERFYHKATGLELPADQPGVGTTDLFRDTVVCTVNNAGTYPLIA